LPKIALSASGSAPRWAGHPLRSPRSAPGAIASFPSSPRAVSPSFLLLSPWSPRPFAAGSFPFPSVSLSRTAECMSESQVFPFSVALRPGLSLVFHSPVLPGPTGSVHSAYHSAIRSVSIFSFFKALPSSAGFLHHHRLPPAPSWLSFVFSFLDPPAIPRRWLAFHSLPSASFTHSRARVGVACIPRFPQPLHGCRSCAASCTSGGHAAPALPVRGACDKCLPPALRAVISRTIRRASVPCAQQISPSLQGLSWRRVSL